MATENMDGGAEGLCWEQQAETTSPQPIIVVKSTDSGLKRCWYESQFHCLSAVVLNCKMGQ